MSSLPNVPVPDELAQVRADIKRLEERESELKRILITDPEARSGASYYAEIRVTLQQRPDIKELRAMYPEQVAEHTHPHEITSVVLKGITEDGELISARKMRKETAG